MAYVVVAALLAALLAFSAKVKLAGDTEAAASTMSRLGLPNTWLRPLGLVEAAGALGLLAGIAYLPLGIAAGVGVVLFFIGAVTIHLRAGDRKGAASPGVLVLIAVLPALFGLAAL
ncbi:DoxX family protein [Streptomyces beijiangensis]|uniref:DoxX family protein n=1 Tax=Streptomyces beijiangensis TaxID=163361 RepID=A0A939FDI5_9ACTN|nr:DoxX family protein [Streptomyces beijiangensis]